MSLLKKFLEDAAVASTPATAIAAVPTGLGDKPAKKKVKKKKKTTMLKRFFEAGEAGGASFDEADVVSKLKNSEKTFDADADTVGFALEDDTGQIVKVFVNAEQAPEFEGALAQAINGSDQTEAEIAEILFDFRNEFDIINIVWPTIPEDEEVDNELAGAEGGDELAGADALGGGDEGTDLGMDDVEGGDEGDMTAEPAGGEDAAASALDKVIGMMTADAEAKKAEAEAKKAQAEADMSKHAADASASKVKAEEEVLDMEAYYKKQADEDKESKKLAQLAKYKHDMASDGAEGEMNVSKTDISLESVQTKKKAKKKKAKKDEQKKAMSLLGYLKDAQD